MRLAYEFVETTIGVPEKQSATLTANVQQGHWPRPAIESALAALVERRTIKLVTDALARDVQGASNPRDSSGRTHAQWVLIRMGGGTSHEDDVV